MKKYIQFYMLFQLTICFFILISDNLMSNEAGFRKPTKVLLVGVEKYPDSPQYRRYALPGTQNDVELFRQFFVNKMGIAESDILILSDTKGKEDESFLPTRNNIEKSFRSLADIAKPDDFFFILLSGHGTEIPEASDTIPHERYGRDSAFLPRDTGRWSRDNVPNSILDHEIGQWIHDIRQKGAFVWFVLDSCHSGGGTRGISDETPKSISPAMLGIPHDAFDTALQHAQEAQENGSLRSLDFIPPNVAFYASLPVQETLSMNLPPELAKEERTNYGIFSYYLCKSLEQIVDEDIQTSYDELIKAIELQYASVPIYGRTPTPLLEGSDVSLAVFRNQPVERKLAIRYAPETQRLNVGLFHGIGAGSVLEVFDKIGEEQKSLGFIKVEHESLYSSVAKSISYNDVPKIEDYPKRPLRCEPIDIQAGIVPQVKIAFDPPKDAYDELKQLLFTDNGPVQFIETAYEEADFLLKPIKNENGTDCVTILPVRSPLKALTFGTFGGAIDLARDDFAQVLHTNFRDVALTHYLLYMAERSERINQTMKQTEYDPLNKNAPSPVTARLSVYKTDNLETRKVRSESEKKRLTWIENNMQKINPEKDQFVHLNNNESLAWVVENLGYNVFWFSVLTIDKDCKIASRYLGTENSVSLGGKASCILPFALAKNDKVDSDIVIVIITAERLTLEHKIVSADHSYQSKLEREIFPLLVQNGGGKAKGVRGTTTTGYFIMKVFPIITGSIESY